MPGNYAFSVYFVARWFSTRTAIANAYGRNLCAVHSSDCCHEANNQSLYTVKVIKYCKRLFLPQIIKLQQALFFWTTCATIF